MTHKRPFYDHFWPFFCQLHESLSQNWDSDGHFEVLSVSKSWLDQEQWHNISWNIFFSGLKMHHFRASLPKWVLTTPKKISSHIFKMAIFPKFFEAFMTYIIRLNRDKEIKLFPELSINKIFGDSFVRFISDRSLVPLRLVNSLCLIRRESWRCTANQARLIWH